MVPDLLFAEDPHRSSPVVPVEGGRKFWDALTLLHPEPGQGRANTASGTPV